MGRMAIIGGEPEQLDALRTAFHHPSGVIQELTATLRGQLDGEVLRALFSVERGFRLPVGVVEGQPMTLHERPRHRLREAKRGRPPTVSFEGFCE